MAHIQTEQTSRGTRYDVHWKTREGKYRQKGFYNKRQAERHALRMEDELAQGNSTEAHGARGKKVSELVESVMVLASKSLKPRTVASYRNCYGKHILPVFGNKRVTHVTGDSIESWLMDLADTGLAPKTVEKQYVLLQKVFKYALRHGHVAANPCAGVVLPTADAGGFAPHFLTPAQVEALAKELDDTWPYGLMIRFTAYTGLRSGELAGLRVRDINLLKKVVEVRVTRQKLGGEWVLGTPKSKRSTRDVPLRESLVTDLTVYLARHPHRANPDADLWPGRRDGKPVWDQPFHHRVFYPGHFRPAALRAGLFLRPVLNADGSPKVTKAGEPVLVSDLRFHDLRHSYASILAASGVEIRKVSRWMGHASISTTDMIYTHLFADDHEADMARVDAWSAGTSATAPVTPLRPAGSAG